MRTVLSNRSIGNFYGEPLYLSRCEKSRLPMQPYPDPFYACRTDRNCNVELCPDFFSARLDPPCDIIFLVECFEHFEKTAFEIGKLIGLIAKGAYSPSWPSFVTRPTGFSKRYYLSDPTRVSFYSGETIGYIAECFRLQPLAGSVGRLTRIDAIQAQNVNKALLRRAEEMEAALISAREQL